MDNTANELSYSNETKVLDPLQDWVNKPTVVKLTEDYVASQPAQQAQMTKIKQWNDLRNVSAKNGKVTKKNKTQSRNQAKVIRMAAEWRYPQISEPFLSSDRVFKITPSTHEDGPSAKQNEKLLNWQMRTKLNINKFVDTMVRNGVDDGTDIIHVGWKSEYETVTKMVPTFTHESITSPQQQELFNKALELSQADEQTFNRLPESLIAAVKFFRANGKPNVARRGEEQEIKEKKQTKNEPVLTHVSPEDFFVDPNCNGILEDAAYVIRIYSSDRSRLMKDTRYANLDQVNWDGAGSFEQDEPITSDQDSNVDMRKDARVMEYWGNWDIHNNGILVPIVATFIHNTMIKLEENPYPDKKPPFVIIQYTPIRNSIYGEPDAEILEDTQKIVTALDRGVIDLVAKSANSQTGFALNVLSPLERAKYNNGEDYTFNTNMPINQSVYQHKFPEIPASVLNYMATQRNMAEALSGIKSFGGGLNSAAYGDVAAGMQGVMDAAAKREMSILRRFANGFQHIGIKLIALNNLYLTDEQVYAATNEQFLRIKRDDLKGNYDLIVDISTPEIDQAKASKLAKMHQTVGPNMDPKMSNEILANIADLERMPELAMRLRTYEPPKDPLQEKAKQIEVAKLEAELQEINTKAELNSAKAQEEISKAKLNTLELEKQITGVSHQEALERVAIQATGNQNTKITEEILKGEADKGNIEAAIGHQQISNTMNEQSNVVPTDFMAPPIPQGLPPVEDIQPVFPGYQ
jgi:hypothetical protein